HRTFDRHVDRHPRPPPDATQTGLRTHEYSFLHHALPSLRIHTMKQQTRPIDADVIIIGSGAGGAAAAHGLAQQGLRILILEKGGELPNDGSTLDINAVVHHGQFLSREPWIGSRGEALKPEEHFNLGGKTKWYGAALLRFSPQEFDAEPS